LAHEEKQEEGVKGHHSGAVKIYFEEELKFMEEYVENPNLCEDYTKVATLSCKAMEEDRNKREF
jgi:hypothetical protein